MGPKTLSITSTLLLVGCEAFTPHPERDLPGVKVPVAKASTRNEIVEPVPAERAPAPSVRLNTGDVAAFLKPVRSYFDAYRSRRVYVQVDKPMYQPGETIWIKTWDLATRDLAGSGASRGIHYELVSPKGAVVLRKNVQQNDGTATNDFVLPPGAQGGIYKVRAIAYDGTRSERPVVVSAYEPPRIKKKLEFVKKAYGPGDEVQATIVVRRAAGGPLASHALRGVPILDGEPLTPVIAKTNAEGGALLRFILPRQIERGDGLLTVMIRDGGVTESISKRIPILLNRLQFSLFPEGGRLVTGLPSRVYVEALDAIGKPADVKARVVDDRGNPVAEVETYHAGLGRFAFTPSTGRRYEVEIIKPMGMTERYPLPIAAEKGCVLRTFDDLDGAQEALRASVRCTEDKEVTLVAMLRENLLDAARVAVVTGEEAVVYLTSPDDALNRARGVARVTVFDRHQNPVAERVVFRNRRCGLWVDIKPDARSYSPREQVALTVRTTDETGRPVAAEVALSVVNDTVLSFADDKEGHILSRLLLETELPGKIEEPNFFFDLKEKKSALAMELLMGTRGWRKFAWRPVLSYRSKVESVRSGAGRPAVSHANAEEAMLPEAAVVPARKPRPALRPGVRPKLAAKERKARRRATPVRPQDDAVPAEAPRGDRFRGAKKRALGGLREQAQHEARAMKQDGDFQDALQVEEEAAGKDQGIVGRRSGFQTVRVFPAPRYDGPALGERTDFRETIHWAPSVKTGTKGKAIVTFYLSDAVTTFRVLAEAAGGRSVGRVEHVLESKLPFSMNVKLPLEVSAGDQILMPLTLTNEQAKALEVSVDAAFGALLTASRTLDVNHQTLAAKDRDTIFYPVSVTGKKGSSKVRFSARASGLTDRFSRDLRVVPLGFPVQQSRSGTLQDSVSLRLDLEAAIEGSADARITLYPSPLATLLSGLDGMLREPHGCFEQTSSTNYPNVMVMNYLQATGIPDPDLVRRVKGLLDRGYQRLVSFESEDNGYEWFGRAPAHEALTAYGLLEFADMGPIYAVDRSMVNRTVRWLKSRRDGKGGFKRDRKALDSFGRADPEITDVYITYALSEAGYDGFEPEYARTDALAETTEDAYLLALASATLLNRPAYANRGKSAVRRLVRLQESNGSWMGRSHSITRSTGRNLRIETTSLALLALMKSKAHEAAVRKGVKWLIGARSGHGSFGTTQATVLALKALTAYARSSRKIRSPGTVTVTVNGQRVAELPYDAGRRDPLITPDLGGYLRSANNEIVLTHAGETELPYSLAVSYRAEKPANHPDAVVDLTTRIAQSDLQMGAAVRVTATVTNRTSRGQPMTLARVGIPGGLQFSDRQLKDLMERKTISFYETRAREVIVYLSHLAPNEERVIPIDLTAVVPGTYTGPASRAYLYYTNEQKVWNAPLRVRITP